MTTRYEYRFCIDAFTPATMPMARLAEYMATLAALLGETECVHFVRLDEGSAVLVQAIEAPAAPKVEKRINQARRGEGPVDALRAFQELDRALAQDNAIGVLYSPQGAEIIRFPAETAKRSSRTAASGNRAVSTGSSSASAAKMKRFTPPFRTGRLATVARPPERWRGS